ncbi:atrial natriuretic peptide receptor 3-like [Patiria miniata]|uniref:Receptor ligand binding region domain-containing protein n=1 Tax=Patiria miniata TaxID=46514 RepID=A0A914A030_PATMI|nr:atrial natriuretic peptide receptor 3-like [Patiria miniata]
MVAMYASIIFAQLLLCTVVHATVNVKVGMLHLSNFKKVPLVSKYYLLPAAQIAFETVAKRLERGVYNNFSMTHVSTDECCTRPVRSTGALAASMYHDDGVVAFLGPAVSPDMAAVADMAAYWNLPVLAGAATSTLLDEKKRFPTLTRTGPNVELMVQFMTAVLRHLGWTSCAILRGLQIYLAYYYHTLPDAVFAGLERNGITVVEVYADQFDTLDKALEKVASVSKVIFISASPVRDIMVHAHRLGLTLGSHVFLNFIPFEYAPLHTSSQFENNDAETVEALKVLFMMRYHVPDIPVYHAFQSELKNRQLTLYGREGSGENLYAAATHDAVLIYADVINEIVAEGGDVRDGRAVTRKMWDRTFQGVTGAVRISANGDRLGVCELLDMTDTKKGTFDVIGTFDEATGAIIIHDELIKWPGGKAPMG